MDVAPVFGCISRENREDKTERIKQRIIASLPMSLLLIVSKIPVIE